MRDLPVTEPTVAEEKRTRLIVRELDTDREGDWGNLLGVRDLKSDRFTSEAAGAVYFLGNSAPLSVRC